MSQNLNKCLPLLSTFCSLKKKNDKQKLLKAFEQCVLRASQEIAINTLRGNVPLTDQQKQTLRRYKNALQSLSSQRTSKRQKKRVILQQGSGIFALLLPIIASAVASAISK